MKGIELITKDETIRVSMEDGTLCLCANLDEDGTTLLYIYGVENCVKKWWHKGSLKEAECYEINITNLNQLSLPIKEVKESDETVLGAFRELEKLLIEKGLLQENERY